jgi:hypothetical protein
MKDGRNRDPSGVLAELLGAQCQQFPICVAQRTSRLQCSVAGYPEIDGRVLAPNLYIRHRAAGEVEADPVRQSLLTQPSRTP